MATYREIKGLNVSYVGADPPTASATSQAGEVWYNSGTGYLKVFTANDTWSTTAPLSTARSDMGGGGIQTAAFVVAGYTTANVASTEEYNGSGWTAGGDLGAAARQLGGCGTLTAGLCFGGKTTVQVNTTDEYDGSTWTEGGALTLARDKMGSAGTQTAGLCFGGNVDPSLEKDESEEYNGTGWTEGDDLNTGRKSPGGLGIQTAALCVGGTQPGDSDYVATVESYDGSSWTTQPGTLNTAREAMSTAGTTTAAVVFGGTTGSVTDKTEIYDGTSWTETTDMSTARMTMTRGPTGTLTAALAAGGAAPAVSSATEEFAHSILTYTPAAWATGGTIPGGNYAQQERGTLGTKAATLSIGGSPGPHGLDTFSYDGTAWTSVNNITVKSYYGGMAGTTSAGMKWGGVNFADGSNLDDATEEYDGTSWTNGANLSQVVAKMACGMGTETAALSAGGETDPSYTDTLKVEEWNGTSWVEGGDLPATRYQAEYMGTQTAGLGVGGYLTGASPTVTCLEYNGASWAAGGDAIEAMNGGKGFGIQTDGLIAAGNSPYSTLAQSYDGTAWATNSTINTGRGNGGGGSTTSAGGIFWCGAGPGGVGPNATEEYSAGTSAATVSTIDFD